MNIYDISSQAGVSIATVSRVLNGNENVSDKTRQKVLKVMEECGYTPNAFARGLGLNTMNTIGIMCSDSSDAYLANAVYHLEQELRKNGYDSILCCTGYELTDKQKYLQLLLTKRVDAMILAGSSFLDHKLENNRYIIEASARIPIMVMNGYLKSSNIYSVVCNDCQAVRQITELFIKEGRKNILFLYRSDSYSANQKRKGYLQALKQHQLPTDKKLMQKCPKELEKIKSFIASLYHEGLEFDAIVASEDIMAIGAMKAAKARGVKIPEHLSICGFNNSLPAKCCEPELTTIDNKVQLLSQTTVNLLMDVLNKKNVASKTTIKANLILRGTTSL